MENKQLSMPMILIVKNISGKDLEDIELFDALKRAWKKETYENDTVKITSGIPSISYEDTLLSIATGDMITVGCFYVQGFDIKRRGFDVEKKKGEIWFLGKVIGLFGNSAGVPIILEYKDEQINENCMILNKEFSIDKRASLKLAYLFKDEQIIIHLYPAQSVNLLRPFFTESGQNYRIENPMKQ